MLRTSLLGLLDIVLMAALVFLAMGCAVPRLQAKTEITKPDGSRVVMSHVESGAQLLFGNRAQSTFLDGSTEQSISKEVTGETAQGLANTAAGALVGGGAGSVVGQTIPGAALGAGIGAVVDGLKSKVNPEAK